jgi:hypothetical protein
VPIHRIGEEVYKDESKLEKFMSLIKEVLDCNK